MEHLSLSDGSVDWRAMVEHVVRDNVTVDIQSGDTTVARITPVIGGTLLRDLNNVLSGVPMLDDAEAFDEDLQSARNSLPLEVNRWDW
jgi:hypothetical protein